MDDNPHMGDDDHDNMDMMDGNMMSMAMYFVTDYRTTILFKGWRTTTKGEFAASCIAVFVFGVLFLAIKYVREKFDRHFVYGAVQARSLQQDQGIGASVVTEGGMNLDKARLYTDTGADSQTTVTIPVHIQLLRTLLHVAHYVLGLFNMLIFMTYNTWLCLCLALGSGVGFFFFERHMTRRSTADSHGAGNDINCCEL